MDLVLNQLASRAKLIWIIHYLFGIHILYLDPIVKRIDKWIENRKNRK